LKETICKSNQFDNPTSAITTVVSIGFLGWDEVEGFFLLKGLLCKGCVVFISNLVGYWNGC
jgi:hypothetical protein